jgi:hypothetical protein
MLAVNYQVSGLPLDSVDRPGSDLVPFPARSVSLADPTATPSGEGAAPAHQAPDVGAVHSETA